MQTSLDSFDTLSTLQVNGRTYRYYAIHGVELARHGDVHRLPVSSKILLENLLRHEDGISCSRGDIEALAASEMAVDTVVTVRDKVVEAYQEILRMPV